MFDELKKNFPKLWDSWQVFEKDKHFQKCVATLTNAGVKHTEAVRAAADATYNQVQADYSENYHSHVKLFVYDRETWEREMGYWCFIARQLEKNAYVGYFDWFDLENPVGCEQVAHLEIPTESDDVVVRVGVSTSEKVFGTDSRGFYHYPLIDCCLKDAKYLNIALESTSYEVEPFRTASIPLQGLTVDEKMKEITEVVKSFLEK